MVHWSIIVCVNDTSNIPQSDDIEITDGKTIRPNIEWPLPIWREVKKAAIDADKNPGKFVVEKMAEALGIKAA